MFNFKLRTLLVFVGVFAVLFFFLRLTFIGPRENAEKFICTEPIKSMIYCGDNGVMTADRVTYAVGHYGVTEIGNVRIAVRGWGEGLPGLVWYGGDYRGGSQHRISIANTLFVPDGKEIFSNGNRRFEVQTIPGGSDCKFGGVTFKVIDGIISLGGKSYDTTGSPRLIVIDASGAIESVEPLPLAE